MARNLIASYQKVQAMTASPAQRVVLVYKGICRHLETAVSAFDQTDPGRFETINNSIHSAQTLITELRLALDKEGAGKEIAETLEKLYLFWGRALTEANVAKDKDKTESILKMVRSLTEGWIEAEQSLRRGESGVAPSAEPPQPPEGL